MTFDVKIAGINITFSGDLDAPFVERLKPYEEKFQSPEITVNYKLSSGIALPEDMKVIKKTNDRTWFYHNNRFCFADFNEQIEKYVLFVSIAPNNVDIRVYGFTDEKEVELVTAALREYKKTMPNIKEREIADTINFNRDCLLLNSTDQALRFVMLYHKVFFIHASAIAVNNSGIVFSAPSGTGKSTHTALWEKYYNAKIINDDSPFISADADNIILHGAPWAGTTGINKNVSVPLKAIVFLEQAPENSITPLMSLQALQFLMRELLQPCDRQLIDNTYTMLNLVLASVPCYLLKCTPDKEAADVVYNEIFKED